MDAIIGPALSLTSLGLAVTALVLHLRNIRRWPGRRQPPPRVLAAVVAALAAVLYLAQLLGAFQTVSLPVYLARPLVVFLLAVIVAYGIAES